MKISQMLKREDFYRINKETLEQYFGVHPGKNTVLFIYPELNAIVTRVPSKQVVDFLNNEYMVQGSVLKRIAARAYVNGCLKSWGFLAAHKQVISAECRHEMLIYPCNKKYRIFNFAEQVVDVIVKSGFEDTDLQHEIQFRGQQNPPDFVPKFVSYNDKGYQERIIDGRPLARIGDGFEAFRDMAYELLVRYGASSQHTVKAEEYAAFLLWDISKLVKQKADNQTAVLEIGERLFSVLDKNGTVTLGFSHGDLQAGNIWVENGTNKIYIIDWESWGTRSMWYDKATLYHKLRPGDICDYLQADVPKQEKGIVLLEDMIFKLNELNNLPKDFGMYQFRQYCGEILLWLQHWDNAEASGG